MEFCIRTIVTGLTGYVCGHHCPECIAMNAVLRCLLSVYFYVCVHVCTVLPRQKGSDCLMKSLSFWRGREVDALH